MDQSYSQGLDVKYTIKYTGWHNLEGTPMYESVSFYRRLRQDCNLFSIFPMEFEALSIEYEADGLCFPGLGLQLYGKYGHALLLQVLERTLPEDNKAIQAQVTSGIDGEGNGYQLLWIIDRLNIPIFYTTQSLYPFLNDRGAFTVS